MAEQLNYGARIISRAQTLMATGNARSWSHAIQRAAALSGSPDDEEPIEVDQVLITEAEEEEPE
jgi:hypothetical protein